MLLYFSFNLNQSTKDTILNTKKGRNPAILLLMFKTLDLNTTFKEKPTFESSKDITKYFHLSFLFFSLIQIRKRGVTCFVDESVFVILFDLT